MAKVRIVFNYNNKTGKREVHIDYQSDPDSLFHEHERKHAQIVKELLGQGVLSQDDDVIVERAQDKRQQEQEDDLKSPERIAKLN